jgi:hypothetical protein
MRNLLLNSAGYEKRLFFVAIAAFGRALAAFSVAVFAQRMCFFFVELDFSWLGVAVADFAIFQIVLMGFVIEGDVAIFGFERNGVGSNGGAGSEGNEHGGNNEFFHDDFSCGFDG